MKTKNSLAHSKEHSRKYGARYFTAYLPDGRFGMILDFGVLDASDGLFYPLPYEFPDERPTAKMLVGDHLVYAPREALGHSGILLGYGFSNLI